MRLFTHSSSFYEVFDSAFLILSGLLGSGQELDPVRTTCQTLREPNYFNGKARERVFETAFLEYGPDGIGVKLAW